MGKPVADCVIEGTRTAHIVHMERVMHLLVITPPLLNWKNLEIAESEIWHRPILRIHITRIRSQFQFVQRIAASSLQLFQTLSTADLFSVIKLS